MTIEPGPRAEPAALTDRQTAPSLASHALALCASCPVRAECLELSLRQWHGAGHYGIWGGTLERERRALRRRWLAGVSVTRLLPGAQPNAPGSPRPSRSSPPRPGQLAGSMRP